MSAARTRRAVIAALVALIALGAATTLPEHKQRTATIHFAKAKGLYVGDDVTILGVKVGKVTAIKPEADRVRVEIEYDAEQRLPADAKAILAAPSVVTVRQVALAPAYTGGPELADGAEIPMSRTAIPVEWDDIKQQVNDLAVALGPRGANADGALDRLLETSAANLDGQGGSINQTVTDLSEAMQTLADNRSDLFGTVRNLQKFVAAIARSDREVVRFNRRLSSVSDLLADNSNDLEVAVNTTTRALVGLNAFLKANRKTLAKSVRDLRPITSMLSDTRQNLADILQLAPHTLSNFYSIYDPINGSITSTMSAANLQSPGVMVCSAIFNFGGTPEDCQQAIAPLAELLTSDPPPVGVSPVENNGGRDNTLPAPGGPESRVNTSPEDGLLGVLLPGGPR